LRESLKSLESLTYTLAHDLRAPIRAMKQFTVALLEDVPLDQTGQEYAGSINQAAERMDQLVNDLLEYGQLSHLEFPTDCLDLKTEIENTLGELAKELEAVNANIVAQEPFPAVIGNETLLRQILSNLILNAVKFVAPGVRPKVLLRAETRGPMVRLWVEDNGIGIAPQYQDRIFGVFQRLHTNSEFPGTGVGLAIVKRAVERMGGTIGVTSEPDKGSRFWFEMPHADSAKG
jgi:signal transduction histidine kinase